MNYYRPNFGYRSGLIPPVIKALLISNAAVFLLTYFNAPFMDHYFGLVPRAVWSQLMLWQPITYMFLHGGFLHILFNMFILWMFGSDLERAWGSTSFLKYYFVCGIGAGLFNVAFQPNSLIPIIGASGAIYGLLVAFALIYPDRMVYVYFLFPIKVKYLVIFLVVTEFVLSMSSSSGGIAHLAHLGGAVVGFIYLKSDWRLRSLKYRISSYINRHKIEKMTLQREKESTMMAGVDRILDKINQVGYDNLTKKEKKTLEDASDKLSKK